MTPASRHRRAIAFMVVAATCWSSGGLLVRALSIANAWEIVFWRSLFMALFVAGVLIVLHGRRMPQAVRAVGRPGLISGLFLAGTFFFFIGSLTRTTVANTFVLMSVSPFLAAIAGRIFLREEAPPRTWIAMAIAFAGIVVMFADSLDSGHLSGNLLALGVSCCFAGQVTVLRKYHAHVDMLPQVMIAGLFSLVVALALAPPFAATTSRSIHPRADGLRSARDGLPPCDRRVAIPIGHRARPARAAGAHPGTALGLGIDGRATGPRRADRGRRCARCGDRKRSVRGVAQEALESRNAGPDAGSIKGVKETARDSGFAMILPVARP